MFLKPSKWFWKSSANSAKVCKLLIITISFHARSESQSEAGLAMSRGIVEPPANRKRHSSMLIVPSSIKIRTERRKENNSLCFSNKLRQTFVYRLYVKKLLIFSIRCVMLSKTIINKEIFFSIKKQNSSNKQVFIFICRSILHNLLATLSYFPVSIEKSVALTVLNTFPDFS